MSKKREEIRNLIFHEFKLNHTVKEAVKNICANNNGRTEKTCFRWFAKFCSGNTHRKDKKRSGRPSKINKQALRRSIEADPSQTSREMASNF